MATVSDSDIKEIKDAVLTLGKQVSDLGNQVSDLGNQVTDLGKQVTDLGKQLYDVEKNLTAKINDVEKNLTAKINEVEKEVKEIKGKNDQLDKRVANQEFIYRAVFIAIISLFTTGAISTLGPSIFKYFWNNPLFS